MQTNGINYSIIYLGHSSWLMETSNYYLIFDYGKLEKGNAGTEKRKIDLDRMKSKKVFAFYSHTHFDHYDSMFHEASDKQGVVSILGGFTGNLPNSHTLYPHGELEINGVKVFAGDSTDAGVCFLAVADNIAVYHGGDNADWGDGDEANNLFYREIDYIAGLRENIDVAFIPVCTFSGKRPGAMTKSAIYSIEKLHPDVTLPMHGSGKEYLYKEFTEDALKSGINTQIICMNNIGDKFEK